MNLLELVRRIPDLVLRRTTSSSTELIDVIQSYVMIVMFNGISIVYYLDMFYLTFDRLVDILLNIKYPLFWNEVKAARLVLATWLLGAIISVVVSLLYHLMGYKWEDQSFKYCYPILNFGFITLAFVTYSFIFRKFKQTRSSPSQTESNKKPRLTSFQVFRNSRFYLSGLLVMTFVTFIVVPDVIYLFVAVVYGNGTDLLLIGCWISYSISNLSDALIYIFAQHSVRKLLMKKLGMNAHNRGRQRRTLKKEFSQETIVSRF